MTTVIQNLPIPPTPADTPTEFNSKAFSLLGALPGFVTQANQLGSEMTSLGLEAGQDAEAARLHKEAAAGSAGAAAGSASAASTSAGQAAGAASAADAAKMAAESARDAAAGYAASIDPAYLLARENHTGTQPVSTITGIGSAALHTAQTSSYDDTAGRLMKVGAFGLGGRGDDVDNIAATINDFSTNFKVYNNSTVGVPDTASGTILNIGFPTGNNGTQILLSLANRMFFRAGDYGAAVMREVWHNGNVAGFLGQGQSWTEVTASRAVGVTYTNTTGKPICVSILRSQPYSAAPLQLTINGLIVDWGGVQVGTYNQYEGVQGIVPVGGTYSVISDTALAAWRELR